MDPYNENTFHPMAGHHQVERGLSHMVDEGMTRRDTSPSHPSGDHQVARSLSLNLDRRGKVPSPSGSRQTAEEVSQNFTSGSNSRRDANHNFFRITTTLDFDPDAHGAAANVHAPTKLPPLAAKEQTAKARRIFHLRIIPFICEIIISNIMTSTTDQKQAIQVPLSMISRSSKISANTFRCEDVSYTVSEPLA